MTNAVHIGIGQHDMHMHMHVACTDARAHVAHAHAHACGMYRRTSANPKRSDWCAGVRDHVIGG